MSSVSTSNVTSYLPHFDPSVWIIGLILPLLYYYAMKHYLSSNYEGLYFWIAAHLYPLVSMLQHLTSQDVGVLQSLVAFSILVLASLPLLPMLVNHDSHLGQAIVVGLTWFGFHWTYLPTILRHVRQSWPIRSVFGLFTTGTPEAPHSPEGTGGASASVTAATKTILGKEKA